MSFTAGLCDECRDQKDIAALYNFDEELPNDLTPKRRKNVTKTLKKAVDARHKEVEIYIFFLIFDLPWCEVTLNFLIPICKLPLGVNAFPRLFTLLRPVSKAERFTVSNQM